MPSFFINRPVFAWVIAILISLFGIISVHGMGIDSYPDIAPPQVTVTAQYPGASAQTMESTVTQVIEQQLTGIDNLLYFSSSSSSNGQTQITLTFATGTNPDIAQVQVQNKVTLAQPLLPSQVTQQGVVVAKASPDILMFIALQSDNPAIDAGRLSDILASQIQPNIGRVNGVGNTTLLGSEYAVRIWLDPDKLQSYGLSTTQVLNAVSSQNAQFAAGSLGADPAVKGQMFTANVTGDSLFSSVKQFQDIIIVANSNGTTVKLSDVARISFGSQTYGFAPVYNGKAAGGLAVFLLPGQCARGPEGRSRRDGDAGAGFAARRHVERAIRHYAVYHRVDRRRDPHAHRGDRAGVFPDADLPAESAGHDHSDARDSGCAPRDLHRPVGAATTRLDQSEMRSSAWCWRSVLWLTTRSS